MIKNLLIALLVLMAAFVQPAVAETAEQEIEQVVQLNRQAIELYQQGKYQEALPLFQRALAIREKVLGPEHDDTAISLNNLALLYKSIGQYGKALPLYQRALAIREKNLGPDHPDTATILNNLAELHSVGTR